MVLRFSPCPTTPNQITRRRWRGGGRQWEGGAAAEEEEEEEEGRESGGGGDGGAKLATRVLLRMKTNGVLTEKFSVTENEDKRRKM